jgi:hypothetical protein
MHRKDTPAARAALAKRRQRAAQSLQTSNNTSSQPTSGNASTAASSSTASSADHSARRNDGVSKPQSAPASTVSSKPRSVMKQPQPQQSQQHQHQQQPHWKGLPAKRRSPKVIPLDTDSAADTSMSSTERDPPKEKQTISNLPDHHDFVKGKSLGGSHTVAGQTVDGTITTAAMTDIMERSQQVAEQSSKILVASLSKSKSYDTTTIGEPNIETVLREDGGLEYVQEVEVRHRRTPHSSNPTKPLSPTTRERISNFGYVEVHAPQPLSMPERRRGTSYYPQPRSPPDIVQHQTVERRPQQQQEEPFQSRERHQHIGMGLASASSIPQTMTPASTRDELSMGESTATASKNLQLPSLQSSPHVIQPDTSRDNDYNEANDATPHNTSSQQILSTRDSDQERTFHYSGRKSNIINRIAPVRSPS